MKRKLFAAFVALAAIVAACAKPEPATPDNGKPDTDNPGPDKPVDPVAADVYINIGFDSLELPAAAGDTVISVSANYALTANSDAVWVSVTAVENPTFDKYGRDTLTVPVKISYKGNEVEQSRSAHLTFISGTKVLGRVPVKQAEKENAFTPGPDPSVKAVADILDVEFLPDGTARDLSGSGIMFSTIAGARMSTYYNEAYGRYAAHFNTYPAGGSISSGFYKADYTSNQDIRDKLADGHSIEMVLRLDCVPAGDREIKAMCSHQAGGTGIMISNSSYGKSLTFLPNVSTNGSSSWRWATAGVTPEAGRWYHIVGVWDKQAGKAMVYINGELKKTVDAAGNLNFATSGATWFCIGGDAANASGAESGWWGDVVIARVYDATLSSERIGELWKEARTADVNFVLTDLNYASSASVVEGARFNIFGEGFADGDIVRFVTSNGRSIDCRSERSDGKIAAVIPAGLTTGDYTILIARDAQVYSVGRTSLTISEEGEGTKQVKCVAHRGAHNGNSCPENSIAALKKAQELGVYGAEFDVWRTTDGGLFINHDGKLSGVTISSSTTAQVENLTLANGEKIPTLRQYLEQGKKVPSVKMVLELKHEAATAGSIALVKELGMGEQVEWISFYYNACLEVRKAFPDAVVQYLSGDVAPAKVATDGLSAIDYSYTVFNNNPGWIKEAHDNGLFVNVWTVDSDFASWIAKGVDVITTNKSAELLKSLSNSYVE